METFHPKRTLICGLNHTGKSSLIRPLFETLGANPQGTLEKWDNDSISIVEFSIDNKIYFALHQRGIRALFDSRKNLLLASADYHEWVSFFNDLTGFNLIINNKKSVSIQADPSCFFLPFYINQDGSWQASWNTFYGLKRYKDPVTSILDYFCGIRPPEYYHIRSIRDQKQFLLDELRKDQRSLERTKERFGHSLPLAGPKVEPVNFEYEIEQLTKEVTDLNSKQEQIREKAIREKELVSNIQIQIKLATEALRVYNRDIAYVRNTDERLVCPTCGAEHSDPFIEFLFYAEDARVLRELILKLRDDLLEARLGYKETEDTIRELDEHYLKVSKILSARRGEMQFKQVVDSMGAESAFKAFDEEGKEIKNKIIALQYDIYNLDIELKKLSDKKRLSSIINDFRSHYALARQALDVPPIDISHIRLTSRPDLSGSGGPRSILAFYSAIWHVSYQNESVYKMPLVIDAPNQQGQDDINQSILINYLAKSLPDDAQVIVGIEKRVDATFDFVIELDEKYKVMKDTEYKKIKETTNPMLSVMQEALLYRDENTLFTRKD